ncbi:hypothetical protein IMZ48_00325, partial [Candidatus Bathyarchaeota archaeon]|nr:hypothetical protein [Candidatus Bathyarchaeota archaeon]
MALELVDRLKLYHAILPDPTPEDRSPDTSSWRAAYQFLAAGARGAQSAGPIYSKLVHGPSSAYHAWTLAAVVPWGKVVDDPNRGGRKSKVQNGPLVTRAAREGIKASNKICAAITEAHVHRKEVLKLKELACSGGESRDKREVFGMAVHRWDKTTGNWRLSVLYAILVEATEKLKGWPVPDDGECSL